MLEYQSSYPVYSQNTWSNIPFLGREKALSHSLSHGDLPYSWGELNIIETAGAKPVLGNQSVKSISTAEPQMRGFNVCFLRKQDILFSTGIMRLRRVPEAACGLCFSGTEASTIAQVRRHLPGCGFRVSVCHGWEGSRSRCVCGRA